MNTSGQSIGKLSRCLRNKTRGILVNSAASTNNTGLCPHGMSSGACPICSGMGGNGSMRVGERPQKAGEMSYHQCAMIGAMMRAREQRIEMHEKNLKLHAQNLQLFQKGLENIIQKMINFAEQISGSFIFKPVAYTIINIVVPMVNAVKNTAAAVLGFTEKLSQFKQQIIDIQDKLNAVFGEAKAFIAKKVSEFVSNIKSKFEILFKVFRQNNTKDDDTKIDEDKKIFNLKTILHKLMRKKKNDTENNSGS